MSSVAVEGGYNKVEIDAHGDQVQEFLDLYFSPGCCQKEY